jgi:glycosyltransferase involved in cell wall biosynthesis
MLKAKSRGYIIATVCKNEGENLPKLIESIEKQTIEPVLWMIVDDGSTDRTPEIVEEGKMRCNWIKSIRLDGSMRDLGLHYAGLLKKGFSFAIEYCKRNEINYEYLANVDGDFILEPSFFKNLIVEFEKDPVLGVASGGIYHFRERKLVRANARESEPSGGNMIIRRRCFEDCEGIPLSCASDSAFNTKAKLRGWRTKRFENIVATEVRDTSSAEGYWGGYIHKGEASYYLNFNPLHVMIKGIGYLLIKPCYIGIAYLYGYFSSLIKGNEKTKDEEIKHYFHDVRPREVKQYYIKKLKNKLKIDKKRI